MSEEQIKKIIVDASIAVKWVNPSEEFGDIAREIFQDYERGRLSFAAPQFFYYEVASGIGKAVARGDITKEEGLEALDDILDMEIYSLPDVKTVYSFSKTHRRSVYDCFYLVLAQRLGVEFWTADKKLYDIVHNTFPFVKWLGDYQNPRELRKTQQ